MNYLNLHDVLTFDFVSKSFSFNSNGRSQIEQQIPTQ